MEIRSLMDKSLEVLKIKLSKIRAGRANLDILQNVRVEYYGDKVPLNQVASLSITNATTIEIDPWEKSLIPDIVKAIQTSDLGINPQSNNKGVVLNLPPLTEERRREYVKLAKKELEESKITLRNIRQKMNSNIKSSDLSDDQKVGEEKKVQKVLDEYNKKAESIYLDKEREILKK